MHASIILANDVLEYSVLFSELADAYFERGLNEEALEVYQELAEHEEADSFLHLLSLSSANSAVWDRLAISTSSSKLDFVIGIYPISTLL